MHALSVMVMPVLLNRAETWAVTRTTGAQETSCLPNEVAVSYCWVMLWERRRNVDILEETGELPAEVQLRHKRLQWFVHLQRMPESRPQK